MLYKWSIILTQLNFEYRWFLNIFFTRFVFHVIFSRFIYFMRLSSIYLIHMTDSFIPYDSLIFIWCFSNLIHLFKTLFNTIRLFSYVILFQHDSFIFHVMKFLAWLVLFPFLCVSPWFIDFPLWCYRKTMKWFHELLTRLIFFFYVKRVVLFITYYSYVRCVYLSSCPISQHAEMRSHITHINICWLYEYSKSTGGGKNWFVFSPPKINKHAGTAQLLRNIIICFVNNDMLRRNYMLCNNVNSENVVSLSTPTQRL